MCEADARHTRAAHADGGSILCCRTLSVEGIGDLLRAIIAAEPLANQTQTSHGASLAATSPASEVLSQLLASHSLTV